jgi:hypothetical protein
MRKNSSSFHETPGLTPQLDADFAKFRELCGLIVRQKQIPTTPDGMPTTSGGILDVLREACARTVAAQTEAHAELDQQTRDIPVEEFLAIRKAEGSKIDARTAEVTWCYAQTLDPYGICELPEEYQQVGREYFARAPGSHVWVCFDDLPQETREALWKVHKHELAFPAGLPLDRLREIWNGGVS